MFFTNQRNTPKLLLVLASFIVVSLILWNTYAFFKIFKEEERLKMEVWATAQAEFLNNDDLNKNIDQLTLAVFQNNITTPMIVVDTTNHILSVNNIDDVRIADDAYVQKLIKRFEKVNTPIQVAFEDDVLGTIYYGNSEVIEKLKYYPIALLLIIFLFGTVIFFFYRASKVSEQNKLWAGMAKETAHQIGTPLSSLLGWNELLKNENLHHSITDEIGKDITRLQTITDRFSKIGSIPTLEKHNLVEETHKAFEYLQARSSKLVEFEFFSTQDSIMVMLNPALYNWSIENLVKNGIDAMKGKGKIRIDINLQYNYVNILVSDKGSGIPKADYLKVFKPGYTTKKRGWGLGLSLVKRIVEEYHRGKIKVLSSSKEEGTVMQISLKVVP